MGSSSKEHKKQYYLANKQKILADQKTRYSKNKKKILQKTKWRALKTKYWPELTVAKALVNYVRLQINQNNKCLICHNKEVKIDSQNKKVTDLAVDHCHITKKVRGLLCFQCNTKLSWFEKNKCDIFNYLSKGVQG